MLCSFRCRRQRWARSRIDHPAQAFRTLSARYLEGGGGERLDSPAALADWLVGRQLLEPSARLDEADLRRALKVREGLRALLYATTAPRAVRARPCVLRKLRILRTIVAETRFKRFVAGLICARKLRT